MGVERLSQAHQRAIEELIGGDPVQNLFLLGFLDASTLSRGFWYGLEGEDRLLHGVAAVVPDRLCVPWCPDPADAGAIGRRVAKDHAPCMMVGPRLACDAMWSTWAQHRATPERFYDQRLYVCREAPVGERLPGFRKAAAGDWETIAANAARMEYEDVGRDPMSIDPETHEHVIRERIRNGKTWVVEDGGRIVFQINVGTATRHGCQVGGTWVPPEARGRGLATLAMKELCRRMLREHPFVSLHVNEANLAAVRVYEKSGFVRGAPYRLITVKSGAAT